MMALMSIYKNKRLHQGKPDRNLAETERHKIFLNVTHKHAVSG